MVTTRKLKLGTTALASQAVGSSAGIMVARVIATPAALERGDEVWVFFRRWMRGRINRVVCPNANLVRRGSPRGPNAIVLVDDGRQSLRRYCSELVPCSELELQPDHVDRESAQEFARIWWSEQESSLT